MSVDDRSRGRSLSMKSMMATRAVKLSTSRARPRGESTIVLAGPLLHVLPYWRASGTLESFDLLCRSISTYLSRRRSPLRRFFFIFSAKAELQPPSNSAVCHWRASYALLWPFLRFWPDGLSATCVFSTDRFSSTPSSSTNRPDNLILISTSSSCPVFCPVCPTLRPKIYGAPPFCSSAQLIKFDKRAYPADYRLPVRDRFVWPRFSPQAARPMTSNRPVHQRFVGHGAASLCCDPWNSVDGAGSTFSSAVNCATPSSSRGLKRSSPA